MSWLSPQPPQQLDDLRLERDVERARRLVGDQQRRLEQQRHRDHDALPHAARELVRVVVQALGGVRDAAPARATRGRAGAACRARGLRGARAARRPCWRPTVNVGFRLVSGSWKIIAISRPRRSRSRPRGAARADRRSRKTDAAAEDLAVRRQQAQQGRGECRLAAARLADDADDLARAHRRS